MIVVGLLAAINSVFLCQSNNVFRGLEITMFQSTSGTGIAGLREMHFGDGSPGNHFFENDGTIYIRSYTNLKMYQIISAFYIS